ncbi:MULTISPECIES: hypothetical protein [unclassified Thiocapsa]|uniref:hypothetical protein n=1 Tax=unclassified Thiocapsa TaxID=2641286 RepID=UPI0035AE3251
MDCEQPWGVGDWCWHIRQATPCRILGRQAMWGDVAYRVWLPTKDAVIRVRSQDLGLLDAAEPTVNQILHTAAAAKLANRPPPLQTLVDVSAARDRAQPEDFSGVVATLMATAVRLTSGWIWVLRRKDVLVVMANGV